MPSEKLVRPVVVEDIPDLGQAASTMLPVLLAVLASFRSPFRGRAALQAELFALRHRTRTHLALQKDAPDPRVAHQRELGEVTALPEVGGLHHRYERRAA